MSNDEKALLQLVTVHTDGSYTVNSIGRKSFGSPHKGYMVCCVCGYRALVHRLVALVHVPNPNNYPYVLHKNDKGTENNSSNLIWGTQQENIKMAYANGKRLVRPVAQYNLDGRFVHKYNSVKEASVRTKVSESSIVCCCKSRYKTAGGFIWKYYEK